MLLIEQERAEVVPRFGVSGIEFDRLLKSLDRGVVLSGGVQDVAEVEADLHIRSVRGQQLFVQRGRCGEFTLLLQPDCPRE